MLKEKFLEATNLQIALLAGLSADLREKARTQPEVCSERNVMAIVRAAEYVGLVKESAMRNSGMMKNGMGMALDHVARRSLRAVHILNNLQGYTSPKKSLYGDNDGIPTPKP